MKAQDETNNHSLSSDVFIKDAGFKDRRKILSNTVAAQIVEQLSKVMEHHINIMNIDGMIIASTDPNRINTLHGGAKIIINKNLSELLIESETQYVGSKNGINLPIHFDNAIVGVIGLTGKTEEVYKYSQIIKKMTEILLLDSFVKEQHTIEQKAKDRFLEEWILGDYHINHPMEFKQRAHMLNIDIQTPKRLLVFAVKKNHQPVSDQLQTAISHHVRRYLSSLYQAYLFRTSTLFICVLNHINDEEILRIAKHINILVTEQFQSAIYIGIDDYDFKPVKRSFKHANEALQTSFKSQQNINIYDIVSNDIFVNNMTHNQKTEFIKQLFNQADNETIREYVGILKTFYTFEGSLKDASQALFIHKNTLQYRLNKILDLTGYDPRKISISYMFMMAIKIYDALQSGDNFQAEML